MKNKIEEEALQLLHELELEFNDLKIYVHNISHILMAIVAANGGRMFVYKNYINFTSRGHRLYIKHDEENDCLVLKIEKDVDCNVN